MNRVIKLIIAASCIFSLIAFPVACGSDDAAEHQAPEKKAEATHEVEPTVVPEVVPEVETEVAPEVETEVEPEVKH
ncbi:MAG: hypothetical protein JRG74_07985 [Deltaproteobacteria bacterium]|nr:hypothetical protein [Deltaproteobacteria bacterium]MBW1833676.1 hypothetical protein [Deltaproteobacteria bacterium]MBW2166020.1 hypothetical protein [Deltaproteobacteria bacterium]